MKLPILVSFLLAACAGSVSPAPTQTAATDQPRIVSELRQVPSEKLPTAVSAAEVVQQYLDGTSSGDLDAVAELMIVRSAMFESGSNEGTWEHYRAHHLGPEIKAIKTFAITPGEKTTSMSADGTLAVVTLAMEYDIELLSERKIESRAVATFALQLVNGEYKIEHVHWSSRPRSSKAH